MDSDLLRHGLHTVWLDVDPGHDDALALTLAGHSSRLHLLGVSTVAGNQTVEKVTTNCLSVLEAAGLADTAVVKGQGKPLMRSAPLLCPEIHGSSGLDLRIGSLPSPTRQALPGKAVNVMFERISAHHAARGQRVSLVCTGVLTNAALLLLLYPEMADSLQQIVLMGGCMGVGNTHPVAEFNIQCDPEAAKVVFESGVKVVMVPLEVTHTALATDDIIADICPHAPFGRLVKDIILYFAETYRTVFNFQAPPLHDPCAVAYVARPDIFQVQHMRVDVETSSSLTAGQTVCDVWGQSPLPPNVHVAKVMDVASFWAMMKESIQTASQQSQIIWPPTGVGT
ncbi:hypothetical protein WJX73_008616 [Symbiochloris irregularis]|uniref:Inosine/uridine-preferring nucleoside hydrolase domain-containing protein n=1 Tax=Symbiochloris irregularis TaxID=706552 RepID=A0AAW1PEU1_9CHLO